MTCVSHSIARYTLVRCIVSAAQFASGELCFYENYAELVAWDAAGETTTPLCIEYDAILHFRVVRQQQLMRIELPRSTVLRWAEVNGFVSELDAGEIIQSGDAESPCALIEQLLEDDMAHFLRSVAPMVAASRRGRSASRVSVTEPLPLSYYPPSPAAAVVAKTDTGSDDRGDDDDDVDAAGVGSGLQQSKSDAARSSISSTTERRAVSSGAGEENRPFCKEDEGSIISGVNEQQRQHEVEENEEEDRLSRCLEVLGASVDSLVVRLPRASSTQDTTVLAPVTAHELRRHTDAKNGHGDGSDTVSLSSALPLTTVSKSGHQSARRGRVPPHVGGDEAHRTLLRRVKRETPPSPRSSSALSSPLLTVAPQDAAVREQFSPVRTPVKELRERFSLPAEAASRRQVTFAGGDTPAAATRIGVEMGGAAAGAAYNFADVMTAPEDAAHLPIAPAVMKMLAELQEVLPPRRRRGAGKAARPPPKKGGAQRSKPAKGRGKKSTEAFAVKPQETNTTTTTTTTTTTAAAAATVEDAGGGATPQALPSYKVETVLQPLTAGSEKAPPTSTLATFVHNNEAEDTTPFLDTRSFYRSREAAIKNLLSSQDGQPHPSSCRQLETIRSGCVAPLYSASPRLSPRSDRLASTECLHSPKSELGMEDALRRESSVHVTIAAEAETEKVVVASAPPGGKSPLSCAESLSSPHRCCCCHPRRRRCCHRQRSAKRCRNLSFPLSSCGDCRTSRWRRVMRQLNGLSVHLTRARACGEELRGLFLVMLDDAEV